jgi:hypothetical protein
MTDPKSIELTPAELRRLRAELAPRRKLSTNTKVMGELS